MNPIAAVLVGHLIGDWILQTDWQASHKVLPAYRLQMVPDVRLYRPGYWRSWRANQQHMLTYHLALGMFAAMVFSWQAATVLIVVSWVTHSLIDRRWPVRALMRATGSAQFATTLFGVIAIDQALHLSILLIAAGTLR